MSLVARRLSLVRRGIALAAVVACSLLLGAGASVAGAAGTRVTALAAATERLPGPDLGPPDYAAYCQSLGFVRNTFTADKHWGCLHADGSISPLDVQAACEFTYRQRPILAKELTPGVLLTWQCLKAAGAPGGGGSGGGGSGGGGGTGGGSGSAALTALLRSVLAPTGRAAKISALLKKGSYSLRFTAPSAGRLSISWYYLPKGARLARAAPKPTLAAAGSVSYSAARAATIRISLTAAGRRMLRHARHMRLTARGAFAAPSASAVVVLRAFTLNR